jgi:hypothetical protein
MTSPSMPQLKRFSRAELSGAIALFAADGWRTYSTDPERAYRALTADDLLSRAGRYYLSLGAESIPGFRLTRLNLEL